jgi:hypothetical protein
MPHYYVSIPALDHKVYKYAGYVNGLNEDVHRRAFEKFGPTGIGGSRKSGPYKTIKFDRYEGDRILEDGSLYGKQTYSPKQLIMTQRDGDKIWRALWSEQSSPSEEQNGFDAALAEGAMMHAFQVGDDSAWDKALEQHKEIEAHQKGTHQRKQHEESSS